MSGLTVGRISFGNLGEEIGRMVDKLEFEQAEAQVLKACLDYLEVKGCCPVRHNTGGGGEFFKRKMRGAGRALGQPDILACWKGKALAVECKATKGKQSKAQIDWQSRWEKAGGVYILARSLAALIEEMGQ